MAKPDKETGIVGGDHFAWGTSKTGDDPDQGWRAAFLATVAVVTALAIGLGIYGYMSGGIDLLLARSASAQGNAALSANGVAAWHIVVAVATGSSVGLATAWAVYSIVACAGPMIVDLGVWTTVAVLLLATIASFAARNIVIGLILLLCTAILAATMLCMAGRIRLARAFVAAGSRVLQEFSGLIATGAGAVMVQILFAVVWAQAMLGVLALGQGSQAANPWVTGFVTFSAIVLLFALVWVVGVVSNVVAVTTARVTALWWAAGEAAVVLRAPATGAAAASAAGNVFADDVASGGTPAPSNWKAEGMPVQRAREWAQWSALGPVSCASLVVALLRVLEALLRSCARDGDGGVNCCALCCGSFIAVARRWVEYYNSYLFAVIGTARGKATLGFADAGRAVYALSSLDGVLGAVVNDWLTDLAVFALTLLGLVGAGLAGAAAGLAVALLVPPASPGSSLLLGATALSAVVVGYVAVSTLLGLLSGSVKALFVLYVSNSVRSRRHAGGAGDESAFISARPGSARVADVAELRTAVEQSGAVDKSQ